MNIIDVRKGIEQLTNPSFFGDLKCGSNYKRCATGVSSMTHWTVHFVERACEEGIAEGRQYDTIADWWNRTQSSKYQLWLLEEIGYHDERTLRLLAVRFVRETRVDQECTVWDLLKDNRSRQAVIVAEKYANGEATIEELGLAGVEAYDAAKAWAAVKAGITVATATAAAEETTAGMGRAAVVRTAWTTEATASAIMAAKATTETETAAARESAISQQADMIREMVPLIEVQELFDRYATQMEMT